MQKTRHCPAPASFGFNRKQNYHRILAQVDETMHFNSAKRIAIPVLPLSGPKGANLPRQFLVLYDL